jgi:hypothetical protein
MSSGLKRKHSNSITSSDYNISPRTSSPTQDDNKFIKCFQLIIILPDHKNAFMNIKNFITCSGLSNMADIKIHDMTNKQWTLIVPENEKTMYFCSEISNGKFLNGIFKGLFFDYKFPCNQKYFDEYSEMYNNAKDVASA